jgi:hypothetical protein
MVGYLIHLSLPGEWVLPHYPAWPLPCRDRGKAASSPESSSELEAFPRFRRRVLRMRPVRLPYFETSPDVNFVLDDASARPA